MSLTSLLPLVGACFAVATRLYVSSDIGTITTLDFCQENRTIEAVSVDHGAPFNPSFLLLNKPKGVVYLVEEGYNIPNGYISTYKTSDSGNLTQLDRHSTIGGPVHQTVYNGGRALAVAHYGAAGITTWTIGDNGALSPSQTFTFTMSEPGSNPSRQEAPHPHEALIDPTDSYVIFNDLGADLIRIFSINKETSALTELTPSKASPGSGPRHGAFLVANDKTYYFLVCELTNEVKSYAVTYGTSGLSFNEVYSSGIYGSTPAPAGSSAGEALISPDGNYLLTSGRIDSLFQIPSFDDPNKTIPSDTLQVWAIDKETGKLTLEQLAPSGGMNPRQFSFNKAGSLVAVSLQSDSRVVIVERKKDGTLGRFVAHVEIEGGVTSVIWDE